VCVVGRGGGRLLLLLRLDMVVEGVWVGGEGGVCSDSHFLPLLPQTKEDVHDGKFSENCRGLA
jgi:hypothetical protein